MTYCFLPNYQISSVGGVRAPFFSGNLKSGDLTPPATCRSNAMGNTTWKKGLAKEERKSTKKLMSQFTEENIDRIFPVEE